jgi:hypothetical protein
MRLASILLIGILVFQANVLGWFWLLPFAKHPLGLGRRERGTRATGTSTLQVCLFTFLNQDRVTVLSAQINNVFIMWGKRRMFRREHPLSPRPSTIGKKLDYLKKEKYRE